MSGFSLANYNPFILLSIVFGALLLIRHQSIKQPNRLRLTCLRLGKPFYHALIVCLIGCLSLIPLYQSYLIVYECSVSSRYHTETLALSRQAMSIMDSHKLEYWLDFATLLAAIRHQTLNQWDHDSDFSILHPDYPAFTVQNQSVRIDEKYLASYDRAVTGYVAELDSEPSNSVQQYISMFETAGLSVDWQPKRHLLQVWSSASRRGPHIDLWLWIPAKHGDGEVYLHTADHTIHSPVRPTKQILPLKPMTWLDTQTKAPNRYHEVSSNEYLHYGGSYMLVTAFPRDCFHNFFNLRWAY